MANKVSTDKKEFAEALFMQGMPQNSIAEKVGVSANTVGKWVKDGCWGEKRAAMSITRKSLQNELLSAIKDKIEELRDLDISKSATVVDQLVKLSATIERLDKEASTVDFIECFMAFGRWLEYQAETDLEITPEFRKLVNKYQNKYILEMLGSKL
mgnify:FL=1